MSTFGSLKDGSLTKQGRNVKSWRKRHFLLQSNVIYYFRAPTDSSSKGYILFNDVQRVEERPSQVRPNMFAVVGPNRTLLCVADTPREAADWVAAIRSLVRLHSLRNAYSDGVDAWGPGERYLKHAVDHGRRVVELAVQVTGHLRSLTNSPVRREQSTLVRDRAAAIGAEGLAVASAVLEVVRSPFQADRRAEMCAVLRKLCASCEAMLPVAKGTSEDEGLTVSFTRLAAEATALVEEEAPDAKAEMTIGADKVKAAVAECGEDRNCADSLARTASRFAQSLESVATAITDAELRARVSDLAREAPGIITAVCHTARAALVDAAPAEVEAVTKALEAFLISVRSAADSIPKVASQQQQPQQQATATVTTQPS